VRHLLAPVLPTRPPLSGRPLRRRPLLAGLAGLTGAASASLPVGGALAATPPATAYIPGDAYVERYRQLWALSCELAATHTALRLLGHHVPEEVMRPLLG